MALSSFKVLGAGCAKCEKLAANAKEALSKLGITDIQVEHIKDLKEIARHGVMLTPAIAINGKAKSPGKVLSVEDIEKLIKENMGNG
jgi:small redox-active disulfide protein 2